MATRTLTVNLVGRTKSLERAFDRSSKSAGSMASGIGKATRMASKSLLGLGGVFVGAALASKPLVEAAVDVQESLSKNTVVFGQAAEGVAAFADTAADALGMSRRQALEATGTFGTLAAAMKIPEAQAADMATTMTQLAADMASFNNASPEETLIALQSGLRGEAEPLRRFGVLLDAATMKQEALKQGLIDNEKMALTPSQKALAAYGLILEQTQIQQGDFERTSDGLANTQRRLSANFDDVKEKLGAILLPAFESAASWLEATGLPAMEDFVDEIGNLGDNEFLQGVATNLGELWTGISDGVGAVADSEVWDLLEDAFGDIPGWAGDALSALDEVDWSDVSIDELLEVFEGIGSDLYNIFLDDAAPALGRAGGEAAGKLARSIGRGLAEELPNVAADAVNLIDDVFGTKFGAWGLEDQGEGTFARFFDPMLDDPTSVVGSIAKVWELGKTFGLNFWEGFQEGLKGPESDFGRAAGAAVAIVRAGSVEPSLKEKLAQALFGKSLGDLDAGELAEVEHKAAFIGGLPSADVSADRQNIDFAGRVGAGTVSRSYLPTVPQITVNLPPGSDGDDVVDALSRWVQMNGPLPDQLTGVGR